MIIECPECRKQISDKTKVCIHCGFPTSFGVPQQGENEKKKGTTGLLTSIWVMFAILFSGIAMFLIFWENAPNESYPNNQQAKATITRFLKQSPDGDSYEPIAWGTVEFNSPRAGTGTKNPIYDKTGTPPSAYSMNHRFRIRNGFGMVATFDIRVFFADESCTEWVGMEYMDVDDPSRWLMEK